MLAKILKNWKVIIISVIITQTVGLLSAILAGANFKIKYLQYNLPAYSPPEWTFGIVWSILYMLIGISIGLFVTTFAPKKIVKKGINLYATQLFLNFCWSIVFFRFELMFLSIVNILALDFLVTKTMFTFKQVSKDAFYLLIPYALWLLFATYLNIAIVILN